MMNNKLNTYSYIFVLLLLLVSIPMAQDARAQCGDTFITQTESQEITDGLTCGAVPVAFFRAFDLNTFGIDGAFGVCAVEVGVSIASNPIPQPITVNLYTSNSAFPDGGLNPIGTADFEITESNAVVTVPVTGVASPGSELVVEIFSPNENNFVIGSNNEPQTGPGYVQSTPCGIPEVETVAEQGFPNASIIVNVRGSEITHNVPTLSEWGLIAMAGVLALAGLIVIKRRKVTA